MRFNILLFDDFTALDVFGPVEVLSGLEESELRFVSFEGGIVGNHQNVSVMTEKFTEDMLGDTWLLPGGMGTRPLASDEAFISGLKRIAEASEYMLTVCTGSALLARTGLLDGLSASSNRRAAQWVRSCRPEVSWKIEERRWVRSGKYFTSAGVSAGIDMALAFVKELFGIEAARGIAARMEYDMKEEIIMQDTSMPAYLYSPENCPCPRGESAGCPNYRNCGMCTANHHGKGGFCACEKDAMAEGFSYEELLAYLDKTGIVNRQHR